MRSKRVIVVGTVALIVAGVFTLVVRAVRVDGKPFDDGVALVERAPADDFALPEGTTFESASEGGNGTLVLMLSYKGQTFAISFPKFVPDHDVGASMDFQMSTLRRREDDAGVLDAGSLWTAVRVRQDWRDESIVHGDGFASRSVRAIASVRRDPRTSVRMWNARGNAVQEIIMSAASGAERRQGLGFVEKWRVPECDDEAELKAKWNAFVERVRGE